MPEVSQSSSGWGLIAGNGKFPFLVLEGARSQGIEMAVIALTALAIAFGLYSLLQGDRGTVASVAMNLFWGAYNIVLLTPIVRAAVFRPPENWKPAPPAFLFAR